MELAQYSAPGPDMSPAQVSRVHDQQKKSFTLCLWCIYIDRLSILILNAVLMCQQILAGGIEDNREQIAAKIDNIS